MQYIGT